MRIDAADRAPRPRTCSGPSSFVGRRGELREIRGQLSGCRLITLTGPGGVGKSRLAHQAEAALHRAFEGGARCIDMAAVPDARLLTRETQDPDLLAHLIATALGVRSPAGGTATEALTAALAGRPVLLLLDNCEHLLPACAALADTLLRACPGLHLMATSREPLRVTGETIFPVRPLPTPDPQARESLARLGLNESVALFTSRARAVSGFDLTDEHAPALAELCRRLEGLPLAIELAASRALALSPAQILERMDQPFALLSRGARTAPARQRTLRACLDWSFELCGKPERLLWARLSVFDGAFGFDAVEGVCADEALPAEDLLDTAAGLVDKSILTTHSSGEGLRYRLLESFRVYGREKLAETGTADEFRRRHRRWCRQAVRQVTDDRWPRPPAADRAPAPLTRREWEVAELVAQGRSNRDIAAALVVSRRTAESHIEHILTKLGLTNRTQIAAWATGVRSPR